MSAICECEHYPGQMCGAMRECISGSQPTSEVCAVSDLLNASLEVCNPSAELQETREVVAAIVKAERCRQTINPLNQAVNAPDGQKERLHLSQ